MCPGREAISTSLETENLAKENLTLFKPCLSINIRLINGRDSMNGSAPTEIAWQVWNKDDRSRFSLPLLYLGYILLAKNYLLRVVMLLFTR